MTTVSTPHSASQSARRYRSATMWATQPVRAFCNCSCETPAKVREMVVGWGGWSLRNPKGSFRAGQFILAKRVMWAMVVWPQTKPSSVRRRMA